MNSTNWKKWALIGLSSTLLIACSKDHDDAHNDETAVEGAASHGPRVPFSGVWVDERYVQMYSIFTAAAKARRVNEFCDRTFLPRRMKIPSMLVNVHGEVFRYNANDVTDLRSYKLYNFMGNVDQSGVFVKGNYAQRRPNYRLSPTNFRSNVFFYLDGGDALIVQTRRAGGAARYLRTNDKVLASYQKMEFLCLAGEVVEERIEERVEQGPRCGPPGPRCKAGPPGPMVHPEVMPPQGGEMQGDIGMEQEQPDMGADEQQDDGDIADDEQK